MISYIFLSYLLANEAKLSAMAIQPPKPFISDIDRKLLDELFRILASNKNAPVAGGNLPENEVALSAEEFTKLSHLLDLYFEQRTIMQSFAFVELVIGERTHGEANARELFLSMRRARGRTRVMAAKQWAEFRLRLGIEWREARGKDAGMSFDHYIAMERKLFDSLKTPPFVREQMISLLRKQEIFLEQVRAGIPVLAGKSIRQLMQISELIGSDWKTSKFSDARIPKRKLVALSALVSDLSVLFISRDWSVAGTISAMSAAVAEINCEDN